MNTKRSYLDSLNAGRRRRSGATLDDISQTLAALEQRFAAGRSAEHRDEHSPARSPTRSRPEQGVPRSDMADLYEGVGERARAQSEGYAAVHRISEELHALRDDLRREFTTGLKKEFETVRDLLAEIYAEAGSSRTRGPMMAELDRIAAAVETLSSKGGQVDMRELRAEIEDLKGAIDDLAREESLQTLKSRWTDFDRRWDSIESHLSQRSAVDQNQQRAIATLNARLDLIMGAVEALPDSLSTRSLDDKIRILGAAIDHVSDKPALPPNLLDAVEDRLDEISRAVAAASATPASFDIAPIERLEARIASLAKQITEVIEPAPAFGAQLQQLSDRIDAIAGHTHMPDEAIDRVARQLAAITDRLEASQPPTDMTVLLQGVEDRILTLSDSLQRSTDDVAARSREMFAELESRLEDLVERFDANGAAGGVDNSSAILADLESRFDNLAARLDADTARSESALRNVLDDRFRELESQLAADRGSYVEGQPASVEAIEARLDALAEKLDSGPTAGQRYDEVIRNLETQIENISAFISSTDNRAPDLDSLTPRLDEIERALAGNHETIMEAARRAAEDAVSAVASRDDGSSQAVAALADDLRQLDAIARRSEERNTKTFEAIHETLLKIVDRLEALESTGTGIGRPADEPAKSEKMSVGNPPAIEAGEEDLLVAEPAHSGQRIAGVDGRSPAEAAVAAAFAALKSGPPPQDTGTEEKKKRGMLGGLSRALTGNKTKPAEEEAAIHADGDDQAGTVPATEASAEHDEPLEPGSGAPDLNAIMKQVRAEHDNPSKRMDPDAAKADFIAAARRAAQAAAAEAKVLKGRSEKTKHGGGLGIGSLLSDKRRPLLIAAAAIMLAIAGFQLSKSFFGDGPASLAENPPAVAESEKTSQIEPRPSDATGITAAQDAAEDGTEAASPGKVRVVDTARATDTGSGNETTTTPSVAANDATEDAPGMAPEVAAEAPAAQPTTVEPTIAFGPQALRDAVAAGDAKAQFEVAARYAEGRGVAADMAKAAEWYTHSAEAGFAPAQYRIGSFYEKGIGVERDIATARTWYQMAAEQGNVSAMHNLAVLHAMGADGAPDNESAVRWFRQAADLGVKDSQFNLAILAAKGVGTAQDLVESYKWFAVAAQNGDKDAAEKRDEVAKALRPEQLAEARAAADLWKPRPVDTEANAFQAPDAWRGAAEETAAIDMEKAIRNIQLILAKNGYDAGPADGIMGERTKQAIREFQKDNGMATTGEVDEELVRALLAKK